MTTRRTPRLAGLALAATTLALTAVGCSEVPPTLQPATSTPAASSASTATAAASASPSASSPESTTASPSSATGTPSSPAPSTSGPATGSPSASSPSAGGSAGPSGTPAGSTAVKRGAATGDDDVDVQVTVAYRGGKVVPEAPEVPVSAGERVEVIVSSDVPADIVISGQPDNGADVDPQEPEDVDFTVEDDGFTIVALREPKVVLVTFVVS